MLISKFTSRDSTEMTGNANIRTVPIDCDLASLVENRSRLSAALTKYELLHFDGRNCIGNLAGWVAPWLTGVVLDVTHQFF